MDRPPFPFSQPLHETRVHKQITHSTIWSEARRASTALAQQRRVPCVAREQGKHGGDEPWMHLLFSLFSYDKTGWPLSVVVRVVVTKQGCLVRKAGQRTVRLTVAPGSWIARTHLLFLLLFLRNTLIENPLDPSNHSITCSTRVVYYTGLGEKRETDLVCCGGGA